MSNPGCQQYYRWADLVAFLVPRLTWYTDWGIFAPPNPNSTIADTEGIEVAWSVKNGYGTRLIPDGTILGIQVLNTAEYVQIVAMVNQENVNINAQDYGSELDGGGQDEVCRVIASIRLVF